MEGSVRLSILEHALEDVFERLDELPPTSDASALRELARLYRTELAGWAHTPPAEAQRAALFKNVLDLNVCVIRASARQSLADIAKAAGEPEDDPYRRAG